MTTLKTKDLEKIGFQNMIYIIDHEQATLCDRQGNTLNVIGNLPIDQFGDLLPKKTISTPILPRNCLQVLQGNKPDLYLMALEFSPRVMKVQYATVSHSYIDPELTKEGVGKFSYDLALPYLQFYIYVSQVANYCSIYNFMVTVSNSSCRENLDTPVYHFPMPNLYTDGRVCWGVNNLPQQNSHAAAAEYAVNLFFNSPFNDHFGPKNEVPAELALPCGIRDIEIGYVPAYLKNWENKFNGNLLDILKIKWTHHVLYDKKPLKTYREVSNSIVTR